MTAIDLSLVSVRPAGPDDADALAAFAERAFRDAFGPHNRAEDMDAYCGAAFAVDRQRGELADRARYTALAVRRGELAGYVQLCGAPPPPCVTGPQPLELKRLYVDQRWHGGGVAAALMAHALEIAEQRGAQTLYLAVWEHNHRAIAFYRKYGFEQVGSAAFTLGSDRQIDPVMALRLPAAAATGVIRAAHPPG